MGFSNTKFTEAHSSWLVEPLNVINKFTVTKILKKSGETHNIIQLVREP